MKTQKLVVTIALALFSYTTTFAQMHDHSKMKVDEAKTIVDDKTTYACPMKCEGDKTYEKAGDCPKCGMDLVEKKSEIKKDKMAISYACPMKCEGDKTYEKAGNCPKCGMKLTEKEMEMKKEGSHEGHKH